jgi:hypothetical protein
MELYQSDLVQMLSFDTGCVKCLLENENWEDQLQNSKDNPIFYRLRQKVLDTVSYVSAIDIALEYNQIRALNLIIKYIVEHQNSYAFSFLFKDNFIELMEKGILVSELLDSNIFNH